MFQLDSRPGGTRRSRISAHSLIGTQKRAGVLVVPPKVPQKIHQPTIAIDKIVITMQKGHLISVNCILFCCPHKNYKPLAWVNQWLYVQLEGLGTFHDLAPHSNLETK